MRELRNLCRAVVILLVFTMIVTASGLAAPLQRTAYAAQTKKYYFTYYDNIPGSTIQNIYFYTNNPVIILDNSYSNTGYRFVGWNRKADGSGAWYQPGAKFYFSPSVDVSYIDLYAQWKKIVFAKYDANGPGSTGTMSDSTEYISGDTVVLQVNAFLRDGYRFTGWNTSADGSGTALSQGASHVVTDAEAASGLTFYARWESTATAADIPKTGDQSNFALPIALALFGASALAAAFLLKRKLLSSNEK